MGRTPIRFSTSEDSGKTWSEPKIVADDPSGKILFCPPVFGIDDGKLYVIYTVNIEGWTKCGAVLSVIEIDKI